MVASPLKQIVPCDPANVCAGFKYYYYSLHTPNKCAKCASSMQIVCLKCALYLHKPLANCLGHAEDQADNHTMSAYGRHVFSIYFLRFGKFGWHLDMSLAT